MIAFPESKKKLLSKNGKKTAAGCGSLFPLCKMNNEKARGLSPTLRLRLLLFRKCVLSPGPAGLEKAWDGAL